MLVTLALEEILSADHGDQNGRKLCSLGGEATSERDLPAAKKKKKNLEQSKNFPSPLFLPTSQPDPTLEV